LTTQIEKIPSKIENNSADEVHTMTVHEESHDAKETEEVNEDTNNVAEKTNEDENAVNEESKETAAPQ